MRQWCRRFNRKGQATAELAIMGTIIIMLLGYLLQQGFIYNARQGLEMYTFRQALALSKNGIAKPGGKVDPVGVSLTVIRDMIAPSFFTGLSRIRLQSSASVDLNPWIEYKPDVPEDVASKQLLQVGDAMIRKGVFIEIPPTKLKITTEGNKGGEDEDKMQWSSSSMAEMEVPAYSSKESSSTMDINVDESNVTKIKTITKDLSSRDNIKTGVRFTSPDKVVKEYTDDEWRAADDDAHINSVTVESPPPADIVLGVEETVSRGKQITAQ